jgi:hypothetical protein
LNLLRRGVIFDLVPFSTDLFATRRLIRSY